MIRKFKLKWYEIRLLATKIGGGGGGGRTTLIFVSRGIHRDIKQIQIFTLNQNSWLLFKMYKSSPVIN